MVQTTCYHRGNAGGDPTYGPATGEPEPRPLPSRFGRYLIDGAVGSGGMGVVYAAYDPELERTVAIKLLRRGPEQRVRLAREAKAMARLSHPNVVGVYDFGIIDGRMYVAMEYVPGLTLASWLGLQARSWRDIVSVFVQAGRGLRAAHAAGLVHRDFKPSNVLLSASGQVKVTDFGLARAIGSSAGRGRAPSLLGTGVSLSVSLTKDGTIMGTPRYMAPEQLLDQPADPRSDLFSFCVALFEALYRQPPFATANHADLIAGSEPIPIAPLPKPSPVPGRLFRALARGLAATPDERWATMEELLSTLDRCLAWQGLSGIAAAIARSLRRAATRATRSAASFLPTSPGPSCVGIDSVGRFG